MGTREMRCLVLLLPLLVGIVQADQCADVKNTFNQCTRNAHQEYVEAMKKGDDGRPAFRARKTCNYLVAAIETCGNGLMEHDCNTAAGANVVAECPDPEPEPATDGASSVLAGLLL